MTLLAAARGLHLLGVLSVFGALLARSLSVAGAPPRRDGVVWMSAALAGVAAPASLVLQAGEMAGTTDVGEMLAAAPVALFGTGFGNALLLRFGLLAGALAMAAVRGRLAQAAAALLAGGACVCQIGMGHAAAPDGEGQRLAEALHVLAAGAWIGGLLPLTYALRAPPEEAIRALGRFSWLGLASVAVLIGGGMWQGLILVGGLPGLLGTGYGHVVLMKAGLLAALLALAARHRFRLMPALATMASSMAASCLARSIRLEATLGAAAILAASSLAGMAPGAHEQPLWPLPWQPVADGWDDPVVASQVTLGLGLVGAACLAGLVALVADRAALRKSLAAAGLAAAAGAGMLIVPRIGAFAAPATPTSFFESPTGFTRRSVAAGGRLYAARCVGCHGVRGFGDGPLAGADRPAPLTGFHLLRRSDGEMFWIVTAGIPAGNRGAGMPGFGDVLSEEQRWLVTDYVRFLAGAEPSDSNAIPLHHHH